MSIRLNPFICGAAALLSAIAVSQAQLNAPALEPSKPVSAPATTATTSDGEPMMLVQASAPTAPIPATSASTTTTTTTTPAVPDAAPPADPGGVGVREFQGDEVGQVLRLLARQAKVNMVVSEAVVGTVTMRLEDVTAMQAVEIIAKAKGLFVDKIDSVYYVKTAAERTAEPTESDSYQFSYGRAKDMAPLVASQLASKDAPQVDERTNTMFYRETRSNIDAVRKLLALIDRPTKQVMIEARLVEVTANPKQQYGIDWSGVTGGKTIKFGGSTLGDVGLTPAQNVVTTITGQTPGGPPVTSFVNGVPVNGTVTQTTFPRLDGNGIPIQGATVTALPKATNNPLDFLLNASKGLSAIGGQFAILTAPQLSVTMSLLNADADAEFLANPRIVTADNMQAKIEITRAQPVAQLNFNEQTATSVFSGFQDKKFGNTLIVKPSVNKDNFITLAVKPEISNKVGDQPFYPPGSSQPVLSPIIDTRSLDSNVLIKSGDTLAIGGLLQDEQAKVSTKVPFLGDIPIIGYAFQHHTNERTKRNLLVFVTPTIIDQRYGTGLEDQISGVHHSGEEYADPNGWRNNAKGSVRLVPTSHRQSVADYPKPGAPPAPAKTGSSKVRFMADAKERDF